MSAIRGGSQATTADVVAWLRAMPDPQQRERIARLLGEPSTRAAIRAVREEAVVEMSAQPGKTWRDVAAQMRVSVSTINKLISAHNQRCRPAPGSDPPDGDRP